MATAVGVTAPELMGRPPTMVKLPVLSLTKTSTWPPPPAVVATMSLRLLAPWGMWTWPAATAVSAVVVGIRFWLKVMLLVLVLVSTSRPWVPETARSGLVSALNRPTAMPVGAVRPVGVTSPILTGTVAPKVPVPVPGRMSMV